MPARAELVGTWNTSVGVQIDMDEAVEILTPADVPLQQKIGSAPAHAIKVEWMDEDLMAQSATVNSAVTGAGSTGSPWSFTVVDGGELKVGDVLWNQSNGASNVQYVVASVNGNAITATDFVAAGVAPANGNVLNIVGQYINEGSAPPTPRSVERVAKFNYTQLFTERVQATRTQQQRAMFGMSEGPYEHELMKKFKEIAIRFERSLVHGQRVLSSDSKARQMGGLFYYISTNTQSNTVANSKTAVNALVRKHYEVAGAGDNLFLMVSPAVKQALSNNIDPTLRRLMTSDTVGGSVVESVLTDFGTVPVIANRHLPTTKGVLLQGEYIKRRVYQSWVHQPLAKVDDSDSGQLIGELSLEVKNEKAHGILTLTDAT